MDYAPLSKEKEEAIKRKEGKMAVGGLEAVPTVAREQCRAAGMSDMQAQYHLLAL